MDSLPLTAVNRVIEKNWSTCDPIFIWSKSLSEKAWCDVSWPVLEVKEKDSEAHSSLAYCQS